MSTKKRNLILRLSGTLACRRTVGRSCSGLTTRYGVPVYGPTYAVHARNDNIYHLRRHMGYTLFNSNAFKVCVIAHKPRAAANVMWP